MMGTPATVGVYRFSLSKSPFLKQRSSDNCWDAEEAKEGGKKQQCLLRTANDDEYGGHKNGHDDGRIPSTSARPRALRIVALLLLILSLSVLCLNSTHFLLGGGGVRVQSVSRLHVGDNHSDFGDDTDGDGAVRTDGNSRVIVPAASRSGAGDGPLSSAAYHHRAGKKGGGPRIALVTTAYYDPQSLDRKFSQHFTSKACYAARHGYDLFIDTYNRLPDKDLDPKFSKIYDAIDILPKYDWIFFSDDDVLMTGFHQSLEEFIQGFGDVDIHLLVPKDKLGEHELRFSNYAFFLRNSEFSIKLLRDWKLFYETCNLVKPFKGQGDQPNMWLAIAKSVYEYHNLTVPQEIYDICLPNVKTLNGMDLVDIYRTALRALDFTTAQSHDSDRPLRAPVAYSELDAEGKRGYMSGLAFQCNHGFKEKDAAFHENALALHFKEKHNSSQWTVRPHFRNEMDKCFGKFYVPNMTILEDHSARSSVSKNSKPIPLEATKNMKLVSTLDEYRYGRDHRRSFFKLPPDNVCIQTTSDVLREGQRQLRAWTDAIDGTLLKDMPNNIALELDRSSCTNYDDKKWEYTRHIVAGTSRFESKSWKILILRDPISAFFSRFAEKMFHQRECQSESSETSLNSFLDSDNIAQMVVKYIKEEEEELNPFIYSLDTYSRMEEWIPKARLREFVIIIDPTQWEISRENAKNALGIELYPVDSPPSFFLSSSSIRDNSSSSYSSCSEFLIQLLSSSPSTTDHQGASSLSAYDKIVQILRDHNALDFELLDYARELVREQNEFYRLLGPPEGEKHR